MNNPNQKYVEKIQSNKTKLFVIISENNISGLELSLLEDTVYKNVQLLSYCNKVTSEYHTIIANLLINYLNTQHLKYIYQSKIDSYVSIDLYNRGLLLNLKDEKTDNNITDNMNVVNFVVERHEQEEEFIDWVERA
jgi:hypothetical protein